MAKDFKVTIAEIISLIIALGLIIFAMIFFKMEELSYQFSAFTLVGYGILELGFTATHLALNPNYKLKQMIVALYSTIAIYGIVLHYLEKYLGKYNDLIVMYWLILFLGIVILVTVFMLLNKFKKDKKPSLNNYINNNKN